MIAIARTDTSLFGRWWWTVDRWTVAAIGLLIGFGALLAMASSPAVAMRLNVDPFHFAMRQLAFLVPAVGVLFAASLLTPRGARYVAAAGFAVALFGLAATFFFGAEIKGASRWIDFGPLSVQPSEFVKPTFAVVAAWLLASHRIGETRYCNLAAVVLFAAVAGLLLAQPDVGMALVISAAWFCQFVLAGLALQWVAGFVLLGLAGMVAAYFLLPHVTSRVDRFLDPAAGDTFQVDRSLEAFMNGGLFGRGPGEGTVKTVLPDAHSDFVFAVAGEEFGLLVCLLIVGLFAIVVLRALAHALRENNLFVLLAAAGLAVQFGLQAAINMGSALRLIPAKGMTLPFISYGGSSLLSVALTMGLLLALTRRRVGQEAS